MSTHLQFSVEQVPIRMYAQEVEPAKAGPTGKAPAIVLLHGAGGNLDFWTSRFGPFLQEAHIGLYAPHYFDRTGTVRADYATINDGVHAQRWLQTIDQAVQTVAARPQVDPEKIVLAGVSLGAFLALGLAAGLSAATDPAQRKRVKAVVEVSGGMVEPYLSQATDRFPPTLILHGAQDNIVPVKFATGLQKLLTQLNVAHRTEILPNEGHWFSGAAVPRFLMAISSFLEEHLRPAQEVRAL